MLSRRSILFGIGAVTVTPAAALAQAAMPSEAQIQMRLEAAPKLRVAPDKRVTVEQFKRRSELRRAAPSIDIQAINFEFNLARIPSSQYRKVEAIARALDRLRRRRPGAIILLEGHTDAVGSASYNLQLSEERARSLRRLLVRRYGIPPRMLETVGYGEHYLLINTPYEDWRNRRVTLRRIDDYIR